MMKPINHHFSIQYPENGSMKRTWICTLAYNQDNKCLGIAVVGKKDQFSRRIGATIALTRTLSYPLTAGRFVYNVENDEELKDILTLFRKADSVNNIWGLIYKFFPLFRTNRIKQNKAKHKAKAMVSTDTPSNKNIDSLFVYDQKTGLIKMFTEVLKTIAPIGDK